VEKRELRHRIKQTPFKKLIRAVEDKARETGSVVVYVSSYRNSKVCPIHFTLLRDNGSWHVLRCPRGHAVDRDAASVLNMLWKTTPTGWVKGVWWDLKDVKRRLEKGEDSCRETSRRGEICLCRGPSHAPSGSRSRR
jgi:putative transposase